jgi:hypothetical protein
MDYDYQRYEQVILELLKASWRDPEDLEIGRDISDQPEVKIIFDGYGDLEIDNGVDEYQYKEGGNIKMESYAIFIHRGAIDPDFMFPEHDSYSFTFGSMLQHRPKEEVCIYAWYDVENDIWDVLPLEDRLNDGEGCMTAEEVMAVLEHLYEYYFKPWEGKFENDPETGLPHWPFSNKKP